MNMKIANELVQDLRRIPGISIFGPEDEKVRSSIVSFTIDSVNPKTIVSSLEEKGIIVAERDIVGGGKKKAVRASPHFFNDLSEVSTFVQNIKNIQNILG
jgi:cysteine desulfurase/selenocysteine lyase